MRHQVIFFAVFVLFCVVKSDYLFYSKTAGQYDSGSWDSILGSLPLILQCTFPMHLDAGVVSPADDGPDCGNRDWNTHPKTNVGDLAWLKARFGANFNIYWIPPTLFQLGMILNDMDLEKRDLYNVDFENPEDPNYNTFPHTDVDIYKRVHKMFHANIRRITTSWKRAQIILTTEISENDVGNMETALAKFDKKHEKLILNDLGAYKKAKELIFDSIIKEQKEYPANLLYVTGTDPTALATWFDGRPVSISLSMTLFSGMYGDTTACTLTLYAEGKYNKIAMLIVPDGAGIWASDNILYNSHMPSLMTIQAKGELFHARVRYVYQAGKEVGMLAASRPDTPLGQLLADGTVTCVQTELGKDALSSRWEKLREGGMSCWAGSLSTNLLSSQEHIEHKRSIQSSLHEKLKRQLK